MIGLRPGSWRFIARRPATRPRPATCRCRRRHRRQPPDRLPSVDRAALVLGALGGISREGPAGRSRRRRCAVQPAAVGRGDRGLPRDPDEDARRSARSTCRSPPRIAARRTSTSAIAAYNALLKVDPHNEKAKVGIALDEPRARAT